MKLANFFHNCYNRGGVLFVPFLFYFGFFLSSFLSSFLSFFLFSFTHPSLSYHGQFEKVRLKVNAVSTLSVLQSTTFFILFRYPCDLRYLILTFQKREKK